MIKTKMMMTKKTTIIYIYIYIYFFFFILFFFYMLFFRIVANIRSLWEVESFLVFGIFTWGKISQYKPGSDSFSQVILSAEIVSLNLDSSSLLSFKSIIIFCAKYKKERVLKQIFWRKRHSFHNKGSFVFIVSTIKFEWG